LEAQGFKEHHITWVTDFDRETITQEEVNKYYVPSQVAWRERYDWHRPHAIWRNLSIGEVCVTACHAKVYELATLAGYQGSIVLEDDTRFVPNFIEEWNHYMISLKGVVWDMIFFGLGDNNYQDSRNRTFFPMSPPASRTAGSYAIGRAAAEKLMSSMVPFSTVSDGEMDYQMQLHGLKPFWAGPHLAWEATKSHRTQPALMASCVDELRAKTERVAWKHHLRSNPGLMEEEQQRLWAEQEAAKAKPRLQEHRHP